MGGRIDSFTSDSKKSNSDWAIRQRQGCGDKCFVDVDRETVDRWLFVLKIMIL